MRPILSSAGTIVPPAIVNRKQYSSIQFSWSVCLSATHQINIQYMKMNTTDYLYVDICFVSIYVIKHISNLRMALKERSKKKKKHILHELSQQLGLWKI